MKKILSLILVVLLVTSLFGCASKTAAPAAETLTGTGDGFGGQVTVTVTKEADKITKVEVVGKDETQGIGTNAIDKLPAAIVEANSAEVDVVSGATYTSNAIIYAVNNALDPVKYPYPMAEEPKEEEPKAEMPMGEAGSIAKLGLGQKISIASSKDASADVTAVGQVDVTIAAVGFDAEGKVASVTLDVAQTKVAFDKDMMVTSDRTAEVKSKKDLGADYGMVKASAIGKEWFEQIEALENWMIGKTVDEITGMKVMAKDEHHTAVPDVPELTSSVTISIDAYQAAVEEAWMNAEDVAGAESVGLGIETHINKSKDKAADVLPLAQVDTYMAATALDAEGNVAATIIDNAQVKVNFDANGMVTSDKTAEMKTKKELKADYGMVKASAIGKEWFEQMEAFEDWMIGKSIDEVTGLKVMTKDESHTAVPDVAELTSSVTISVESYQAVVVEAAANAK